MSKAAMIRAIQQVADALDSNNYRITFGEPGNHLEDIIGQTQPTGKAWLPEPKSWPLVVEGLARYEAVAREMASTGPLEATDRRVELTAPGVAVMLPPAGPSMIGEYTIKAKGVTGGSVQGTIDGAPASLPVVNWDFIRIYCNGTNWLTG